MLDWLWSIPALPLLGFLVLLVTGGRLPPRAVALVGVGSVGLAAMMAALVTQDFLTQMASSASYEQVLWTWLEVDDFVPSVLLHLDRVSLTMMLVIAGVGFLIHWYAAQFMAGEEGYSRFFAYMNLFVAFMLILVLAGDLLLLFVGWEGVGLCSYLLIGHWYTDAANGRAARKAFVVTRIGDAAMLVGLLLLFTELGTTNIATLLERAPQQWVVGAPVAVAAALLLLGGAVGKSAQLPLQVWLPDAMAGPTPVSALIHAATMVTAGVYLIARLYGLYELAPSVQLLVGAVGALTLLLAAVAAIAQTDIKRILAYSTISQIGYMFLALGVGATSAALFHFMTHAFFKALLFLAAGAVILSLDHEHDIFRMGGLYRGRPLVFGSFLIGAAALAALPLITAGFYSKDLILWQAWQAGPSGVWLWLAGMLGAFLTAFYIFRTVFVVFFGEALTKPTGSYGLTIAVPMLVLAVLSLTGGWINVPEFLAGSGAVSLEGGAGMKHTLEAVTAVVALLGVGLAYWLYLRRRPVADQLVAQPALVRMRMAARAGLGFDDGYDRLLVRPFLRLVHRSRNDVVDSFFESLAVAARLGYRQLSRTQSGVVRWYVAGVTGGAVLVVGITLWL